MPYINQDSTGRRLSPLGKVHALVQDGARIIPPPSTFKPHLVCVVENGFFDAAALAFSPAEMEVFLDPGDDRTKTWLEYEFAEKLAT
jgi:hypothetical protein